jgi:hypothetical protein
MIGDGTPGCKATGTAAFVDEITFGTIAIGNVDELIASCMDYC